MITKVEAGAGTWPGRSAISPRQSSWHRRCGKALPGPRPGLTGTCGAGSVTYKLQGGGQRGSSLGL